jgi:hypothetical protein
MELICDVSGSHGGEYDVLPPSSGRNAPLKRRSTTSLHGVISQKARILMELMDTKQII